LAGRVGAIHELPDKPAAFFPRLHAAVRSTAPVRSTRGVFGLVRQGALPAVVPDAVMAAVMQRADADSGLHRNDRPLFSEGEPIRLVQGPLAGLEGVFSEEGGERRVIVLLELLGKANKIKVDRDWVIQAA